jgi:hypothetical protein
MTEQPIFVEMAGPQRATRFKRSQHFRCWHETDMQRYGTYVRYALQSRHDSKRTPATNRAFSREHLGVHWQPDTNPINSVACDKEHQGCS